MADIDATFAAAAPEFQIIDCVDDTPARDTRLDFSPPVVPHRRCVCSQDLPRFSRTSLQ
jgi:hypothetical protein